MNSNRIRGALVLLAGIMTGMVTETANACNPDLGVVLGGPKPEWVHVNCHLPVDATASGGWVSKWKYYVYPGGTCERCDCQYDLPCGDPPPSDCSGLKFPSVGTYALCIDVYEMDGACNILDSAWDSKTVYAVKVDLSASSTTLCVGGPRVRVGLIVQWAGPTTNSIVTLGLSGGGKVWSSQTGGTLLLQSGQSADWAVGSQPSQVWVEGTASPDCVLQISCRDKNSVRHPCTTFPSVHFTTLPAVGSITHSKPYCWNGGQITFTAIPDPSGSTFPSGEPVWTASAGSFPGGNTGPSVTWQAPSGTGGYATITATCCSSRNDTVSYGFVSIGSSGGELLRSESDQFSATVLPSDFPVTFAQDSSTSPHLGVEPLGGFFLEVDNLILGSDLQAWEDAGLAAIQAIVPDLEIKVFNRTYNLKKRFADWAANVVVPDGRSALNALGGLAKSQGGDAAYNTFTNNGFNYLAANYAKNTVRDVISQGFDQIDPFPGDITDSIINESRTFSWTYNLSVTTADLTFRILPGFEPPGDVGAWIRSINDHGFTGVFTGLETGPKVTLTLRASGTDWNAGFNGSAVFSDNYGDCTFAFMLSATLHLR